MKKLKAVSTSARNQISKTPKQIITWKLPARLYCIFELAVIWISLNCLQKYDQAKNGRRRPVCNYLTCIITSREVQRNGKKLLTDNQQSNSYCTPNADQKDGNFISLRLWKEMPHLIINVSQFKDTYQVREMLWFLTFCGWSYRWDYSYKTKISYKNK